MCGETQGFTPHLSILRVLTDIFLSSSSILKCSHICLGRGGWRFLPRTDATRFGSPASQKNELSFLKEPVESRASRRIFLRSFYDKAAARFSSGFVLG